MQIKREVNSIIMFGMAAVIMSLRPISIDYFLGNEVLATYSILLAYSTIGFFMIGQSYDSYAISVHLNDKIDEGIVHNVLIIAFKWYVIFLLCILLSIWERDFLILAILSSMMSGNFLLASCRIRYSSIYHRIFLLRSLSIIILTVVIANFVTNIYSIVIAEFLVVSLLFTLYYRDLNSRNIDIWNARFFGPTNRFSKSYLINSLISNSDKFYITFIAFDRLGEYIMLMLFANLGYVLNGVFTNYFISKKISYTYKLALILLLIIVIVKLIFFSVLAILPLYEYIYFIDSKDQLIIMGFVSITSALTFSEFIGISTGNNKILLISNIVFAVAVVAFLTFSDITTALIIYVATMLKLAYTNWVILNNAK